MIRISASFLAAVLMTFFAPSAESTQKGRLSQLMVDKLRSSQGLLQGIALADYAKIISSAEELLRLSRTAEWLADKTPRYEVHSNSFQRAAELVIEKAKARNIDGVVLAYQDLTMSCVRCHQYLREVRDARAPSHSFDPTALVRR
jgi:cytochrome c556